MSDSCASKYFANIPETLVLEGYRYWAIGIAMKNPHFWNKAWNLFATKLAKDNASRCMDALVVFIRTLGLCASCPLKALQPACEGLCRDECLVLGLISGLQHGDDAAVRFCLTTLTCKTRCDEVAFAAGELAFALKAAGSVLMPIPADTLTTIALEHMPSNAFH